MPPTDQSELQSLFLANCDRWAKVTAMLGVPGDEPIEKILAHVRRIKRDADLFRSAAVRAVQENQTIPTPITDENEATLDDCGKTIKIVPARIARIMEREIAIMRVQLTEKEGAP